MSDPSSTGPDASAMAEEGLPEERFPGAGRRPFRVHFAAEAHRDVWEHAQADTSVEICGVLLGLWKQDDDGPYVAISAAVRGDAATSKFAEVTFTQEAWARIHKTVDAEYADRSIVGWYHTHPDFGVFLSERDVFIHQHFFDGPGQVAHVVDPIRRSEGVFAWRNGKPEALDHFWVGESPRASAPPSAEEPASSAPSDRAAVVRGRTPVSMLLALAALVAGYLLSNLQNSWQQQRLTDAAVVRLGIMKAIHPGLTHDLADLDRELTSAFKSGGDSNAIASVKRRLGDIRERYALNDSQVRLLDRLILQSVTPGEFLSPRAGASAYPAKVPSPSKESRDGR